MSNLFGDYRPAAPYTGPRGYTVLEALDEITDEQMGLLEGMIATVQPVASEPLKVLHDTLTRIRKSIKGRLK